MRARNQETWFWIGAVLTSMLLAVLFIFPPQTSSQTSSAPLTGYAWSDTIGWVSFDGTGYGVTIEANGTLSGYAWSDVVGWISANASDVTGCPSSPCTPSFGGGTLTGWFKALGGGTAQSGGWDGFIRLSGPTYGITSDANGVFSGYAWGSDVVGWLAFDTSYSTVETGYQQCTPQYFCADGPDSDTEDDDRFYRSALCVETFDTACAWGCANGGCFPPPAPRSGIAGENALYLVPTVIAPGMTVTATWNVLYATSCMITINGVMWIEGAAGVGSDTSDPITETSTFILTCIGDGGTFEERQTVIVNPAWQEV